MFANWEEVFESFSEIEKFEEYVGDSTANCYGEEVPVVVNEQWVYSRDNFLWALS